MAKGSSKKRPAAPGGDNLNTTTNKSAVAEHKPNQIVICKQSGCHDISTIHGFCRFHYLSSWKKLKSKEAKKKGMEINVYLEEMAKRFPEEFLSKLRLEIEEMAEKEALGESEETTDRSGGLFDQIEDEEDLETIIHGLKVEDF